MEQGKRLKSNIFAIFANTWKVATIKDIPIKIHWSFWLLLLFVSYTAYSNGLSLLQSISFVGFFLITFLCVILHEYGHALTARRFGIKTEDIIISPIGGLARLQNMPEKPFQEFSIAIAGPLVNLVIGIILSLILWISVGDVFPSTNGSELNDPIEFVKYINLVNFALFLFNLIPAFPMDGGRILRALLSVKLGRNVATKVSSLVGKGFAIIFIGIGIFYGNITLSIIGLFIFLMAGQEYSQTKIQSVLKGIVADKIMRTTFTRLHLSDTYTTVIQKYQANNEHNFLVFDSLGNLSGAIPELFIKDTIQTQTQDKSVNQLMSTNIIKIAPTMLITDVIDVMRTKGIAVMAVIEEQGNQEEIIGVLDRNLIESYLRLHTK